MPAISIARLHTEAGFLVSRYDVPSYTGYRDELPNLDIQLMSHLETAFGSVPTPPSTSIEKLKRLVGQSVSLSRYCETFFGTSPMRHIV